MTYCRLQKGGSYKITPNCVGNGVILRLDDDNQVKVVLNPYEARIMAAELIKAAKRVCKNCGR